jgi:uroporphyrinogen decarboxylase
MNSRERVVSSINHNKTDRVPADFGSHPNASIHILAYENLKKYLGINGETKLMHRWMQVVEVDERILSLFNIDTRYLPIGSRFNTLERQIDKMTYSDQWGVVRRKSQDSNYYELMESPLSGEIGLADIKNYSWPNPYDSGLISGLYKRASELRNLSDCAIVLTLPSPFIHTTQFLRGFEDWFVDIVNDPKLLGFLFDTVLNINIATTEYILKEVGDLIDIVTTGDDVGGQDRLMISPAIYRSMIKPRHQKYFELIHDMTKARLLFHTCGSVYDIIDDLIEIGVDALNPVQVSASKMNPGNLLVKTKHRIALWGGIDTHKTLPYGKTEDVQNEVLNRVKELGVDGGYVLCAVHNIQPDVSPENISALFSLELRSSIL